MQWVPGVSPQPLRMCWIRSWVHNFPVSRVGWDHGGEGREESELDGRFLAQIVGLYTQKPWGGLQVHLNAQYLLVKLAARITTQISDHFALRISPLRWGLGCSTGP